MDETLLLISVSCILLAILVYLMWKSATAKGWSELSHEEKYKWRLDEEKRKSS